MGTQKWAPVILRAGLSVLFLWFGLSQVTNPAGWVSWLPTWAAALSWISPTSLVLFNGAFETVLGIALALGFYVRWVALLLALHLFFIAYELGYNDIGVRDFVLAISTFSLSAFGGDEYTLERIMRKNVAQ